MTQTQTPTHLAPPPPTGNREEPPKPAEAKAEEMKPEDLEKRLEALEVRAGLRPPPPVKNTVTAYYKTQPFKPEPEMKDEKPAEKAARESRDKAAKEKAGKTIVYELPPVVYEEAKNGRMVSFETPVAVDDGTGHETMTVAKFVVPADADAWSLEDPAKGEGAKGAAEPPPDSSRGVRSK